jgi:hypothetical protein
MVSSSSIRNIFKMLIEGIDSVFKNQIAFNLEPVLEFPAILVFTITNV